MQLSIEALGHTICNHTITASKKKTAAARDIAPPNANKQLASAMGTLGLARRFMPDFATAALPLYQLLATDHRKFSWLPKHQAAMDLIKQRFEAAQLRPAIRSTLRRISLRSRCHSNAAQPHHRHQHHCRVLQHPVQQHREKLHRVRARMPCHSVRMQTMEAMPAGAKRHDHRTTHRPCRADMGTSILRHQQQAVSMGAAARRIQLLHSMATWLNDAGTRRTQ